MDYVAKLNLYREAGVREYWICDPQCRRVVAYRFGTEELLSLYPFGAPAPSGLFEGFEIDFAELVGPA